MKMEKERKGITQSYNIRYMRHVLETMDDALHFIEMRSRKMSSEEGKMVKVIERKGKRESERELKSLPVMYANFTSECIQRVSLDLLIYSVHVSANCFLADMRLYRALIEYQTMASALLSTSVLRAVGSRPLKSPNDRRTIAKRSTV